LKKSNCQFCGASTTPSSAMNSPALIDPMIVSSFQIPANQVFHA
jgi:hypothetical protein